MNKDNSVTGSSGSSYIGHGSYQYTIDLPDPPSIFIEWSPNVLRPGILLWRKNQDSTIPSFSDKMDSNTTVDTIQREDILDTASKPIRTTYYKRWCNHEDHLFLPGEVFQNQGLLYASHLHHTKLTELIHPQATLIIVVAVFSIVINSSFLKHFDIVQRTYG
jgi:hypothetical protein